ncbi:MAG: hypothetical protein HN411_04045 [Waddliaceae bacterium]|jgi:hypothetical protein|nr:hypothetical protein [Waddliaceae bacterium]MBT3579183.1 hypothetical protein [Waddliaceae bacterium]MBT4444757.1 hypothetical protein [Waddliaceae bacterium]MBT6928883.1 hypothetical protein [Waddliaceae bacterium]MBT7264131.1 hypothetical protein [Waddliaceae bacterium]
MGPILPAVNEELIKYFTDHFDWGLVRQRITKDYITSLRENFFSDRISDCLEAIEELDGFVRCRELDDELRQKAIYVLRAAVFSSSSTEIVRVGALAFYELLDTLREIVSDAERGDGLRQEAMYSLNFFASKDSFLENEDLRESALTVLGGLIDALCEIVRISGRDSYICIIAILSLGFIVSSDNIVHRTRALEKLDGFVRCKSLGPNLRRKASKELNSYISSTSDSEEARAQALAVLCGLIDTFGEIVMGDILTGEGGEVFFRQEAILGLKRVVRYGEKTDRTRALKKLVGFLRSKEPYSILLGTASNALYTATHSDKYFVSEEARRQTLVELVGLADIYYAEAEVDSDLSDFFHDNTFLVLKYFASSDSEVVSEDVKKIAIEKLRVYKQPRVITLEELYARLNP